MTPNPIPVACLWVIAALLPATANAQLPGNPMTTAQETVITNGWSRAEAAVEAMPHGPTATDKQNALYQKAQDALYAYLIAFWRGRIRAGGKLQTPGGMKIRMRTSPQNSQGDPPEFSSDEYVGEDGECVEVNEEQTDPPNDKDQERENAATILHEGQRLLAKVKYKKKATSKQEYCDQIDANKETINAYTMQWVGWYYIWQSASAAEKEDARKQCGKEQTNCDRMREALTDLNKRLETKKNAL